MRPLFLLIFLVPFVNAANSKEVFTKKNLSLATAFEENRGQSRPDVLYEARDRRGSLAITRNGARVTLAKAFQKTEQSASAEIEIRFPGAKWTDVRGEEKRPSQTTLLLGNDPGKWVKNIAHFGEVRVAGAYPGVDIVFHARRGAVEFDYEVAPGADARVARIVFPGRRARLGADGALRVATEAGELELPRPEAYQDGGKKVESRFELQGRNEARVKVGTYDRRRKLTIDPALGYLTYHGGSGSDSAAAIAFDAAGNIYVAGSTASANFPSTKTISQINGTGGTDAYVSKFSPSGALLYSTIIGGKDTDRILDMAVDSQGSVYFCGATTSSNFPLAGAIQSTNKGGSAGFDAIFGKLNPAGTALVYSSYYGGNYDDLAYACTVDGDGNLYMTGYTMSDNFPVTPGVFQPTNRSIFAGNGFVTKIGPAGDKAVFSTYIGGTGDDILFDLALDKNRNIYVTGTATSSNYPTVGAVQPTNRGNEDAILSKLNAAGTAITWSTFLGGTGRDNGYTVRVDGSDNVFVSGTTTSATFPTTATAPRRELLGPSDMFLMKFDATGTEIKMSTLFGGTREEEPYRMAIDRAGSVYVVGFTGSTGITPVDAVQAAAGGGQDAFLVKFNNAMDTIQMFTYLGGSADDMAQSVALDNAGRIAISGRTVSTNLPTTANAAQTGPGGGFDGFVAVIDTSAAANPFTVSTTRLTFSGEAGAAIPRQQFSIRATAGVPEWTIDAATTSGGNWLSATPRSGTGSATIDVAVNTTGMAAGSYTGQLTVANTRLGTRTIIAVPLTLTGGGGTVPNNGVVSAATFADGGVTPGMLVTIFGQGLGPAALTLATLTAEGKVSTTLGGTRVLFDNVAAPLIYVSSGQLSAIVPYGVAGKATTSMQVEYQGLKTNAVTLKVIDAAPGLFTANSSGKGPGAILNEDNSTNTASNPARPGKIIILYGTGEGATDPEGQDGVLATSVFPKPKQPVTVRIGGKDAEVLYAGAAPGLVAGVFQINVRIPADTPEGAQPVVVQIGAASSAPEVTVAVAP